MKDYELEWVTVYMIEEDVINNVEGMKVLY